MTDHLFEGLTESQREAVAHVDGPILVLAGPGSGKTRVVTHRIAYMLKSGVYSSQIVALTFTNKAAEEMRSRVERLAPESTVWVSTFHRFCARLLRAYSNLVGLEPNYTIYDTSDSLQILKRAMQTEEISTSHATPEKVSRAISWAKNNMVLPERYEANSSNAISSIVRDVYPEYQRQLRAANAVDFDDMLMLVAQMLQENPDLRAALDERFRYILVDEYQDTNLVQYLLVRSLSQQHPNLGVTGDPDQSIYGWRGANLNNILDFEKDFEHVKVVRLEQNFRSTPNILSVADHLIEHNKRRKKKSLFTDRESGQPVRLLTYVTSHEEAQAIATRIAAQVAQGKRRPRDFALFYRVNALSRAYEEALRQQGIPYMIVSGVEFYQRKEIKDVLAYAMLLNNPRDDVAFTRIVNTPTRGIGKTTILKLQVHALDNGISMMDAAREAGVIDTLNKRAAVAVAKFVSLFDRLSLKINEPVEEILGAILSETGYRAQFENSDDEDDVSRLENIDELLSSAREFDFQHPEDGTLEQYLEDKALVNETDEFDTALDRVTLMTLHAAKGLEFPHVFIVAIEEGLLPHERSKDSDAQLEEERRLLFVGITRAQEELELSTANQRDFRGRRMMTVPSKFLFELPRDEMDFQAALGRQAPPADDWEDIHDIPPDEFDQVGESGDFSEDSPSNSLPASSKMLMTAADMVKGPNSAKPKSDPDQFHQSMAVLHPTYGLGKIIAMSGEGAKRTATVQFVTGEQKKFVLAFSELRPASKN
ncbi:ATP-dependent helicase [Bremerella sp. T1]|uniref:ATP-dependent helicase n=1 Tax=Bremerella sp. TYQ1 TaxID=3119568 RepID=UPI001CCC8870|nr:UvrD-helicase domain-containing protein [Bremerella volcania]UBM35838.1 UvrD-helicase domain-containing protein [Bremerella volcania]